MRGINWYIKTINIRAWSNSTVESVCLAWDRANLEQGWLNPQQFLWDLGLTEVTSECRATSKLYVPMGVTQNQTKKGKTEGEEL